MLVIVKVLALLLTPLFLFALELSVSGGKENNTPFSIIHIKDSNHFLCESVRNDFEQTTQVICAFAQRPSQSLQPISNNFFDISFSTKKSLYFIRFQPHFKMQLFPMIFDLKHENTTFTADVKMSKEWMIVGYMKTMPFLKKETVPATAINFPVTTQDKELPFVGGLDIKGNPIHISKIKDVSDYLAIKRFYKAKDYEKVLSLIDDVLKEYPDTVFKSELLLYQIRSYHFLENSDDLLDIAKIFLREYASDEHVPEVLAYTARAYSAMGLYTDSDYFFERLFDEHENNRFAHLGMIYKAEQLDASGNAVKALKYYEKAFYATKDVDIASLAAFKMSEYYIDHNQAKMAKKYVDKILAANSDYFAQHLQESLEMAMAFSDHLKYKTAADIVGAIYAKYPTSNEDDEKMLKDQGVWLAKAGLKEEALFVFNKYLDTYKYGQFVEEVQEEKDALFFENSDMNVSVKLAEYENLIETYPNDSIGDKALYKKAKLLNSSGAYQATLDLNASLHQLDPIEYVDVDEIIHTAAKGLMRESLQAKKCRQVINLSQTYNVTLSSKWDSDIFECAFKGGNYTLAKTMASTHLKEKNITERMAWLLRYIKTDFQTGNYSEVVDASKELITLVNMERSKEYDDVRRLLFDAYQRLGNKEGMIGSISEIEKAFGLVYKDSERYAQMVTLAQNRKDDQMVVNFAMKVMQLQKKIGAYTQTPYVEFTLAQAYINLAKEREALKVLESLNDRNLNSEKRSRQKYQLGSLYQKLSQEDAAKTAYEESIKADENSAWAKLSKDTLALLK